MKSCAYVARVLLVSVKMEETRSRINLGRRVHFSSLWFEIHAIGILLDLLVFEERELKGRREQRLWRMESIILFWPVLVCAQFMGRWPSWNSVSVNAVAASNKLLCAGTEIPCQYLLHISYSLSVPFPPPSVQIHIYFDLKKKPLWIVSLGCSPVFPSLFLSFSPSPPPPSSHSISVSSGLLVTWAAYQVLVCKTRDIPGGDPVECLTALWPPLPDPPASLTIRKTRQKKKCKS